TTATSIAAPIAVARIRPRRLGAVLPGAPVGGAWASAAGAVAWASAAGAVVAWASAVEAVVAWASAVFGSAAGSTITRGDGDRPRAPLAGGTTGGGSGATT